MPKSHNSTAPHPRVGLPHCGQTHVNISSEIDPYGQDIEYFWRPDLSGTLQGAGGVGGLVAISVDGDFYFPGYDNNGNVIGYWNEDGEIVAEYAYDAFGNTIYEDGDLADFFPHRFSTKYYDAETDLYYYGYRYYSPSLGRWISRDPIEESGGINLFLFCNNNPLSKTDSFGMRVRVFSTSLESSLAESGSADAIVAQSINSGKAHLRRFQYAVKGATDEEFDALVRCEHVQFNKEKFVGTKAEYINLIDWELSSELIPLHGDKSFINELQRNIQETSLVPAKPYDWLVVASHGSVADPEKALLGDTYQYREMIEDNAARMIRPSFQGKVLFISCFRDWKKGTDLADLISGFSVGLPIPPYYPKKPNGEWAWFSFYSFSPYLQVGSGPLERLE